MINNSFLNYIKRYKFKSIFVRTISKLFLFILIPLIIVSSCFIFFYSKNLEKHQQAYKEEQNRSIYSSWETFQKIIVQNNNFLTYSHDADFFYSALSIDDLISEREAIVNLTTILKNSINQIDYFDSIYLYSENLDYVLGTNSASYYNKFWDIGWLDKKSGLIKDSISVRTTKTTVQKNTLSFLYNLSDYKNELIVYNLDYDFMVRSFKTLSDDVTDCYIYDSNGKIMFSYDINQIGLNIKNLNISMSQNTINKSNADNSFTVLTVHSSNNNSTIITSYSIALILFVLILIIIATVTSFQITVQFYKSLVECLLFMRDIVGDNISSDNEVKLISNSIFQFTQKHHEFERELATYINELKRTQVVALQEQINPHFIFNTLNMISMLDLSGKKGNGNHEISDIVTQLSEILRFIMENDNYFVTFEKEILYLKKYVNIQSHKYGEKINTIIDIPDNIMNKKIIKFTLQPIVENAIIHRRKTDCKDFLIKISAKHVDDMIIIDVFNTGTEIDSETLSKLQKQLETDLPLPSKHIGLANVSLRYRYIFGEQFGCSITSSKKGVTVQIKMPYNI